MRLLLCLPLCLLLAPSYPHEPLARPETAAEKVPPGKMVVDKSLPDPNTQPIAFLEACLKRYDEKIHSYSLLFQKQERIDGKLKELEIVGVHYRDRPFSVYFHWIQPANHEPRSALYVEGENKGDDGKSRVKVYTGIGLKLNFAPDSPQARKQGRYMMDTFGLRQAMERVLDSWKAAAAEKALHVEYLGQEMRDDRKCYKFHRGKYARPEADDGVSDLIILIDCETLLQVASIVRGRDGEMLGEYYFRDIRLNPEMPEWQFTGEAFKKDR